MKTLTLLALSIIALSNSALVSAKTTPVTGTGQAIEIYIGGIGPGVDMGAYKKVRQLIGKAVTDSVIDKFVVLGYGREGGFSACVEGKPSNQAPSKDFEKFVKQLNNVKPNPSTTAYNLNRIATCAPLVTKPATVWVGKSDGGLQCENNGISITTMQSQLVGIGVYSASKQNDGLIRITLCGASAGNLNVYEIAATDLTAAIALGFSEWVAPK
jgi:hypothetical protein